MAVITSAGKLRARYVIHAPTMEYPAMRIGPGNVRKAARAALETAVGMGLKTVAFPGMGTGVGGVGFVEAAHAMLAEMRKYSDRFDRISIIDILGSFIEAFRSLLTTKAAAGMKNVNQRV